MAFGSGAVRLSQLIIDEFQDFVERGESLALLTVVESQGSTYSKHGGQILIGADGTVRGLLSGGCLEGDLAEQAVAALKENEPRIVDYDLRDDDDVFGLGVGCEGLLRIHVQPLLPEHNYAPFAECVAGVSAGDSQALELATAQSGTVFRALLTRPVRLLLLGAGQDIDPLVAFARSLGWHITVSDHRLAYVNRLESSGINKLLHTNATDVAAQVDLDACDAAIVMSHHLSSDREYLQQLAHSSIEFIGLLGPPHRRDRLLAKLGDDSALLVNRLHAPVGRRIGGRGAAAIALEIVAELQAYFCATRPA